LTNYTTLRTAVDNDGTPDKEATSYNDIFDAFRLSLTIITAWNLLHNL